MKALVGLSGGVDSAIAALMLQQSDYHVLGVNLKLFKPYKDQSSSNLNLIGKRLGIPIIEYDGSKLFRKEVMNYYLNYHLQGLTPSPCVVCNPFVKWKLLNQLAKVHECQLIATGHYVRIDKSDGRIKILKGKDQKKDQSYYFWNMSNDLLSGAETPLGNYTKKEVRFIAELAGLSDLNQKKESSGLCFTNKTNCAEILNEISPGFESRMSEGKVLDRENNEIGRHKGYAYYTIGQKKGLNLKLPQKLCVSKIDPETNTLWADKWQNLYKNEIKIHNCNFLNDQSVENLKSLQVKVRGFGLNPEGGAVVNRIDDKSYMVKLDQPAWALAPGQPLVFYRRDELIGGGIVI